MGRPAIDLTNQRFGSLIVLKRGHAKSCGCLNKEVASKKATLSYKDLTNQKFGKLTAKEYIGSSGKESALWLCHCDCGNNNFITTSAHLISGNTQSCGCLKSKGEEKIKLILQQHNINYEQEKIFSDLPLKRFDFYLPNFNLLIEYDGQQHYQNNGGWNSKENLENIQKRDKIKNEYALSHNIPLVRIPYWERDNITLDMLMGDKYLIKT